MCESDLRFADLGYPYAELTGNQIPLIRNLHRTCIARRKWEEEKEKTSKNESYKFIDQESVEFSSISYSLVKVTFSEGIFLSWSVFWSLFFES